MGFRNTRPDPKMESHNLKNPVSEELAKQRIMDVIKAAMKAASNVRSAGKNGH